MVVGTALAVQHGVFFWPAALAALATALALQVAANFANDLGDYLRRADPAHRVGPARMTSAGFISPGAMTAGMWATIGVAAVSGLYLIWRGGWPAVVVGAASILGALAYTLGPLPLGYHGLGDLAVFIFFGLVGVVGTYYVQALAVTPLAFVAAVPVGALVTAILVVNNVRDVDTDREAGKRTLAVRLGRDAARREYALLLVAAYLAPVAMLLGFGQSGWVMLPLLSLPLAWRLAETVFTVTGPGLNVALAGTAQLAVIYAALLGAGLVI